MRSTDILNRPQHHHSFQQTRVSVRRSGEQIDEALGGMFRSLTITLQAVLLCCAPQEFQLALSVVDTRDQKVERAPIRILQWVLRISEPNLADDVANEGNERTRHVALLRQPLLESSRRERAASGVREKLLLSGFAKSIAVFRKEVVDE